MCVHVCRRGPDFSFLPLLRASVLPERMLEGVNYSTRGTGSLTFLGAKADLTRSTTDSIMCFVRVVLENLLEYEVLL